MTDTKNVELQYVDAKNNIFTCFIIVTLFLVECNSFLPEKVSEGDGGIAMNFSILTYQSNIKKEVMK